MRLNLVLHVPNGIELDTFIVKDDMPLLGQLYARYDNYKLVFTYGKGYIISVSDMVKDLNLKDGDNITGFEYVQQSVSYIDTYY